MSWATLNQVALALIGLTATYLAMHKHVALRRWAPHVGLAGQPFWFASAIPQGQWGMVLLCCAYTSIYARAVYAQLRNSNS